MSSAVCRMLDGTFKAERLRRDEPSLRSVARRTERQTLSTLEEAVAWVLAWPKMDGRHDVEESDIYFFQEVKDMPGRDRP